MAPNDSRNHHDDHDRHASDTNQEAPNASDAVKLMARSWLDPYLLSTRERSVELTFHRPADAVAENVRPLHRELERRLEWR
jgi:hypothetical protein